MASIRGAPNSVREPPLPRQAEPSGSAVAISRARNTSMLQRAARRARRSRGPVSACMPLSVALSPSSLSWSIAVCLKRGSTTLSVISQPARMISSEELAVKK